MHGVQGVNVRYNSACSFRILDTYDFTICRLVFVVRNVILMSANISLTIKIANKLVRLCENSKSTVYVDRLLSGNK